VPNLLRVRPERNAAVHGFKLSEVNASAACLDAVVSALPSMRQATVAPLFGNGGYAVKAAVPRELLPQVIPAVKAAGGTDVVVSTLSQIVP